MATGYGSRLALKAISRLFDMVLAMDDWGRSAAAPTAAKFAPSSSLLIRELQRDGFSMRGIAASGSQNGERIARSNFLFSFYLAHIASRNHRKLQCPLGRVLEAERQFLMKRYAALAVLFAVTGTSAEGGNYKIVGMGKVPCATWNAIVRNRDSVEHHGIESWLHGYLTAYNNELSDSIDLGGDASKGLEDGAPIAWAMTYCEDHPTETVAKAAQAMLAALLRRRAGKPWP
jgi:hypothetical protein